MVYILGHRGDFENYESNSKEGVISSFEKCDGVELDLNVSADNIFFFCHEKDLIDKIIARNYNYKDIYRFFKKDTILSLEEGIQLVNKYNKILCIHAEIGGGGEQWSKPFSIEELKNVIDICKTCIYKEKIIFHTISEKTFDFCSKEGFKVLIN